MKYIKLLVLPLLASFLIPLSGVNAQTYKYNWDSTSTYDLYDYDTFSDEDDSYSSEELTQEQIDALTAIFGTGVAAVLGGTALTLAVIVLTSVLMLIIGLPLYIYKSIALMTLGKRMGYKNSWFAWIPYLSTAMLYELGNFSPWFALASLAPMVYKFFALFIAFIPGGAVAISIFNWVLGVPFYIGLTILGVITYMNICEKRGYDKYLGLLCIVPFGNLILLGILAWGKEKEEK